MDKRAGLDVASGIDMQVSPAACNAAALVAGPVFFLVAGIFSVVPKVHGKDWLGIAESAYLLIHKFPLLSCDHQLRYRRFPNGHISKEPAELGAPFHHLVKVFLAAHIIYICAGIAGGDAEGQLLLLACMIFR